MTRSSQHAAGWLLDQLQLQAESLSGHLQFFWPDVMNSSWVGGTADVGLHERTPYWLNGFVPLAYQLEDPYLIGTVAQFSPTPAAACLTLVYICTGGEICELHPDSPVLRRVARCR